MQAPIRVTAVELAIFRDHLRLEPEPELHIHTGNTGYQVFQPAGQLALIYEPVSKRGFVIIPVSEPAVIQHEQLNPEFLALLRNTFDLIRIEIEVRSFPIVNKNGTFLIPEFPAGQPCPVQLMIGSRHAAKTSIGIDCHRFRSLEAPPGA
ncbi:hypothetical protein D3C81_1472480 [compost metagenome]